jgi:hypothetical protein
MTKKYSKKYCKKYYKKCSKISSDKACKKFKKSCEKYCEKYDKKRCIKHTNRLLKNIRVININTGDTRRENIIMTPSERIQPLTFQTDMLGAVRKNDPYNPDNQFYAQSEFVIPGDPMTLLILSTNSNPEYIDANGKITTGAVFSTSNFNVTYFNVYPSNIQATILSGSVYPNSYNNNNTNPENLMVGFFIFMAPKGTSALYTDGIPVYSFPANLNNRLDFSILLDAEAIATAFLMINVYYTSGPYYDTFIYNTNNMYNTFSISYYDD